MSSGGRYSPTSVDSIVEKCIAVFTEIMVFSQSLEKKMACRHGFAASSLLSDRIDFLNRNTRPGKQLSKSSILLVQGVIEALLIRGQMQEKDLKEYLVAKFKKLGLKVSNRSVFGGTSLEVSSVCNVLGALGLLESIVEGEENIDVAIEPANESLRNLNDALRVKFENTPFEPSNRSEHFVPPTVDANGNQTSLSYSGISGDFSSHQTDEMLDSELLANMLMGDSAEMAIDEGMGQNMLEEVVSEDFLPKDGMNLSSHHSLLPPAVDSSSQAQTQPAANVSQNATLTTKRQYQTGRKFWRIKRNSSLPNGLLGLVSDASPVFLKWMETNHDYAASLEIEEKMLRRLCGELDIPLDEIPIRDGTQYVQSNGTRSQAGASVSQRIEAVEDNKVESNRCGSAIASTTRDLFDGTQPITGEMLIEKVLKSKRQRHKVAQPTSAVGSFAASHLQSLRSVCQKTETFLSAQKQEDLVGEHGKGKKQKATSSDAISLAEYMKTVQQQFAVINANTVLNSLSSVPNLILSGTQPSLTSATIRRYAPPHQLTQISSETNDGTSTATTYPIQLPDLAISTVEVPWVSLVPEFSLVVLDESGEFVDGLSNKLLSHAELSLEPQVQSASFPEPSSTEKTNKKRSRSSSSHLSMDDYSHQDQISVHHALKRKIISEVLAPEVKTHSLATESSATEVSISEEKEEEEDTSDDHYLLRHDTVLKTMRERWALLNRLKNEVRRDQSIPSGGNLKRQRTESMDHLSITNVTDDGDYALHETVSLTPLIKKRGRPPKFQKSYSSA